MIQKKDIEKNSFTFDIDSQVIRELGERLVTKNYVGLSELVKNSYDADSEVSRVILQNVMLGGQDIRKSRVIIEDQGQGMTLDVLKKYWMTIGTTNKLFNPNSEAFGRPRTGNKGIGRFACQKLAKKLTVVTTAKVEDGYQKSIVQFDWDDFQPGIRLSTVECKYHSYVTSKGETGTKLILSNLREKWTERDYKMLVRNISLVSVATPTKRKGYREDRGFDVKISSAEFKNVTGDTDVKLGETVLKSGWGTLIGEIDSKGRAKFNLKYKSPNPNQKDRISEFIAPSDDYKPLAGLTFTIHIIPLRSNSNIETRRNSKILTKSNIDLILNSYSGIKLFMNKFRVYPYGDVTDDDDWLGISKDISRRRTQSERKILSDVNKSLGLPSSSRPMLNHPGARSLVGQINVEGDTANAFSIKMDREGLVDTANFRSMKEVVRTALDWSTLHYEAFLQKARKARDEEKQKDFLRSISAQEDDDKTKFIKAVNAISETSFTLPQVKREASDQPSAPESENLAGYNAKDFIINQYELHEQEINTLRSISATAPLLFVFYHEVKGIANTLLGHATELEYIADRIENQTLKKQLHEMSVSAKSHREAFNDLFSLFNFYVESNNSRKKTSFKNLFERTYQGLKFFADQFNIDIKYPVIAPLKKVPKLSEPEAFTVLINVLSNSIKSLIASSGTERNIEVVITEENEICTISIIDNGVGLKKKHWEEVFDPYIFDPENKIYSSLSNHLGDQKLSTLGKGSGLGLHITRSIITQHKGGISFCKPPEGWSAKLDISLPVN